jgi:methylase of polypeptide subunit release factors
MSPQSTALSGALSVYEHERPQATQPRERILRPRAFVGRGRPVKIAQIIRPLVESHPELAPEAWVCAAASELAARSHHAVPNPWLEKLNAALSASGAYKDLSYFGALPKSVLNDPSFLSGVLAVARECAAPERSGRAGRVSAGSVYTPVSVARAIIAELKVGARRVVDPACGAGAFLLEAFQRGYRRRLEGGESPQAAARAVLRNEISGIDIDAQALAVAEFSLRMAALKLSRLDASIPLDLRHADALQPLKGLDGSCECIVGNPPFVEGRGLDVAELKRLRHRFKSAAAGKVNLFAVFIERALELLTDGGVMAFIVPATFQRNERYRLLRELLLTHTIESIRPLTREHFEAHVVETVVLRVRKRPPQSGARVQLEGGRILQSRLPLGPVLRFCDHLPQKLRRQVEVMERHGVPLSNCFEVRDGISTGFQPFPQRLLGRLDLAPTPNFVSAGGVRCAFDPQLHRKIIDGGEFSAYSPIAWEGRYIEYDKLHEHTPPHPGRPFNCQLRDPALYDRPEKCVTRQTACGLIATLDSERYFVRNSVHVTFQKPGHEHLSLEALCACLNTRLYTDYFLAVTGESGDIFPQVHIADLRRLPILPGLLRQDGRVAEMGRELLELHRAQERHAAGIALLKASLERELAAAFGI